MFRTAAADRWSRAKTLGISRDRLLFAARSKLSIGTRLDMRFIVGRQPATAEVFCSGRVVRLKHAHARSNLATYSATIEFYRLHPMALSGVP
jgi:hypothetical protein